MDELKMRLEDLVERLAWIGVGAAGYGGRARPDNIVIVGELREQNSEEEARRWCRVSFCLLREEELLTSNDQERRERRRGDSHCVDGRGSARQQIEALASRGEDCTRRNRQDSRA